MSTRMPAAPGRAMPWYVLVGLAAAGLVVLAVAPQVGLGRAAAVWIAFLAVALVVVGALRPEWAVALLAIVTFTNAAASFGSESLLPALLAAVFGAAALLRRRWDTPDALVPFLALAGLYVSFALVSMLWAVDTQATRSAAVDLGFTVLLAAGVIATISSAQHLRWAVGAIIAACSVLGLLALRQFVGGDFSSDLFGLAQADFEQIAGTAHAFRAGGPFADANFFGQVMVVSLALSLERMRSAQTWMARSLAMMAAGIALGTVLVTYSRGALLAAAVVGLIALLRMRNRVLALTLASATVVGLVLLAPAEYADRVAQVPAAVGLGSDSTAGATDPAIVGRSSSWIVAREMAVDAPVAGIGYGNYPVAYLEYSAHVGVDWRGEPRAPHSLPLQIVSEQGLVGLLLAIGLVGGAFVSLRTARGRLGAEGRRRDYSLLGGINDALVGYLVASVFLHSAHPAILWVLLALAWSAIQIVGRQHMGLVIPLGSHGPSGVRHAGVSERTPLPPRPESPPVRTHPR